MAWFKKEEVKEETKTADQSSLDINKLVEAMRPLIKEEVAPVLAKVEAVEGKWNKLETDAAEAERKAAEAEHPPTAPTENELKLAAGIAITNARLMERDILDGVRADGWGDLVPKIQDWFNKADAGVKSRPDYNSYCTNIVDMVVGRAAREKGLKYDGQTKSFFLEDKSSSGEEGTDSPLNKEELQTLKNLNIDPKAFLQNAKSGALS